MLRVGEVLDMKELQKSKHRKLINDLVRINVLEEEVEYYKTLIRPTDTGHVHTAINFIQDRIRILKGRKKEWPFDVS